MTQVVEERDGWTEHVGTNVDPRTKARLFERAHEEMTSVSSVLRRAVAAYLERDDTDDEGAGT